jgi:ribonuclease BN (tRNA processing enzyme)
VGVTASDGDGGGADGGGAVMVTVLGSAGTHAGPGRACSSYLVESAGTRLLLDCGNGSLANLQRRCDVADLDALVLTHLHPDHFVDVYSLYYALRFHPRGAQGVAVYAPGGACAHLSQLLSPDSAPTFASVLDFHEVAAGDEIAIGDAAVQLHAAAHPVETLACRVVVGDHTVAYTADSGYTRRLVPCARDADVLLCDATWLERQRPLPEGIHMTGAEAGRLATEAGARTLVLTHIIPTNDATETAAEAAGTFDGTVHIAHDLLELAL